MSSRVVAVDLRGLDEAELTWEARAIQKVALRFLSTGRTGDVYEALDAPYVLQITRPELRAVFWINKADSIPACSPKVFPSVYGGVSSGWRGRQVKVMVVERVRHTMRSWFRALMVVNHEPDEIVVQLVKHVTKNFFRQVVHMANDVSLHFSDLTLDRVGVRESGVTGVRREEHKSKGTPFT